MQVEVGGLLSPISHASGLPLSSGGMLLGSPSDGPYTEPWVALEVSPPFFTLGAGGGCRGHSWLYWGALAHC